MKPEYDKESPRGSAPQCADIYSFNIYNLRKLNKVLDLFLEQSTSQQGMKKLGLSLWLSATKRMMPRDRVKEGCTFIWDGLRKSCCRVEKVELRQG